MLDKILGTNKILFAASPEITMQPTKFESLISPPWPLTEEPGTEHDSSHLQRKQENLSNFERNEKSEENLDYIAVLGYN